MADLIERLRAFEGSDELGNGDFSLLSEAAAEIEALRAEVERLRSMTAVTMGVGSGDGNLFVHGDCESIKAAQAIVLERGALRAEVERLTEALKRVAQSLEWHAHGCCRGFDDDAPLPTGEAVELAKRTLAKVRA